MSGITYSKFKKIIFRPIEICELWCEHKTLKITVCLSRWKAPNCTSRAYRCLESIDPATCLSTFGIFISFKNLFKNIIEIMKASHATFLFCYRGVNRRNRPPSGKDTKIKQKQQTSMEWEAMFVGTGISFVFLIFIFSSALILLFRM